MDKAYKLSKDYQLLRKLLDNGNEIACFFNGEICKGKIIENRRYYFSTRGMCYNDFSKDCPDSHFSEMMSQDNVEFVLPNYDNVISDGFKHICYKSKEDYCFGDIISFSCERGVFNFCLRSPKTEHLFITLKGEDIIYII